MKLDVSPPEKSSFGETELSSNEVFDFDPSGAPVLGYLLGLLRPLSKKQAFGQNCVPCFGLCSTPWWAWPVPFRNPV